MNSIKNLLICSVLLLSKVANAQSINEILTADEFLQIVKMYHPVMQLANIEVNKADAQILQSKSNLEPTLNITSNKKVFDGITYYNNFSPEIKIPTWYGVDIISSTDFLTGLNTNPEESYGQSSVVGVKIPILKNLLIDKRRATIQQAKIFYELNKTQQESIINDLCMEAITSYWVWVKAYWIYTSLENSIIANKNRLEQIKTAYSHGERPAIDTVEALAQLQSFQFMQSEKYLEYINATIQLSSFLWQSNNQPIQLPQSIIPDTINQNNKLINYTFNLNTLEQNSITSHPQLIQYKYKLNILEIDKKIKKQEILPNLEVKYNFLTKKYNIANSIINSSILQNNYAYGVNLDIPLFFRQGKANYKIAKLKIQQTKLEQGQKQNNIINKVRQYYNEYNALKNQVEIQNNYYLNNIKLAKAEITKFNNGESSVFLINTREIKALEAQQKLIEIKTKYYKSIYALKWSAGILQTDNN